MNEITKLYENAGVEKDCRTYKNYFECPFKQTQCEQCEDYDYPPLTANNQIKLIKWLAIRFNSDYMAYWHNEIKDVWIFRLYDLTGISSEEPYIYEGRNKDFTEALCDLFNDLWQDLTEEERKQIKEILE